MKKFIDILLVFSLSMLIFTLFFNNDKKTPENILDISFEKTSYTIPASVKVLVKNYTEDKVNLNICNDITILKSWEKMNFEDSFCKDIDFEAWKTNTIDYAINYEQFDQIGKYTLEANVWEKKYIDQFELKNKWIIKKTFIWIIYRPIYNAVIWLMTLFWSSFGWAIVWITLILRFALVVPQHKMMVSQKKIQNIQPKIKQIQEQYKWDQQKIWQELMALYSKEKINPFGSCGFLLIQLPILLVVYNIIRWIQTPANAYYFYNFFESFSLQDINFDFLWLDLLAVWGTQWIILALVVALLQFIQVKISLAWKPKVETKEIVLEKKKDSNDYSQMMPNPETMNKFMLYWMPIMIWIFTYGWFAAIGLYWGLSAVFTIVQNLIVNKNLSK